MRTLKYSITKILIYTISALLIYFLKTQVFAMTCDSDYSTIQDTSVSPNTWTFTDTTSTDWGGGNMWRYETGSNKKIYFKDGYDYMVMKFAVSYGINNQSNAESTDIDTTMSIANFFVIENTKNSNNDSNVYGLYKDGFAYFRFDKRDYPNSNYISLRGMGVHFPNFYYNFGRSSLWVYMYRWFWVEYYKCDTNSNIEDKIDETNDHLQETQDYLEDDNTSGANSSASGFFNNFSNTDHGGLSGIVSAPMRLINALSSSSCSALTFPLPFVNEQVTLPCMSPIYSQNFGAFLTLYRLITTGLIGYWVCIKLYGKVRAIKKPEDDRIEVLEL